MTKLLIDTCVWLDIAKMSNSEGMLNLLSTFIERDEISLILPEIIIAEFARNKDRVIADAGKSLSSSFKKVKQMIAEYGSVELKDVVLSQLTDADKKIPMLGENVVKSIERIETIFSKAEKIPIDNEIKLRATQRAIDKIAPFHLAKNSMGDAIIIECYDSYRAQQASQEFGLMFVTHNVNDFSVRDGNQKLPHKDIKQIFSSPKSQYFINLPEALKTINSELVEEADFESDWDFEFRPYSEILEVERELEQKIWYNRHKVRAHLIKTGKIDLIDHKDFELKNSQSTILKDVWKGALKSAKKVEKIYGAENLEFDDFEWGMINGKLSALRWVIGDDWDNLDT